MVEYYDAWVLIIPTHPIIFIPGITFRRFVVSPGIESFFVLNVIDCVSVRYLVN